MTLPRVDHEILVIGCGVAGLSTALLLQGAGHRVTIWTAATPPRTTSNIAAAFWYPYRVDPAARVHVWANASYRAFHDLAAGDVGVLPRDSLEVLSASARGEATWAVGLPGYRAARADELPAGAEAGIVFSSFVIETSRYLEWLQRRFLAGGGTITLRRLAELDEASDAAACVVHCAGLGAGELARDPAVYPVRGQIVRVRRPAGVSRVTVDEREPAKITYVVPRSTDVVLGGTTEVGVSSTEPDPATTAAILARCAALDPHVADPEILEVLVGLRPCRPEVRLEREVLGGGRVRVHNYGHGGAGITLSWGCAAEAAALAVGGDPAEWLERRPRHG
ncbi:MAG: FAD-dependent oxidoreductase [Nannocystaceae bacterium]